MAKPSSKSQDAEQLAESVLDSMAPDAEPKQPVADKAKPPRPKNKLDAADIDRADSEGMAQPQDRPQERKNPAAVTQGTRGGLKDGKAQAAKLSTAKRKASGKKAADNR